ncbi:uncharacterized protein LOC126564805 [Anopheles maculipalpis]|uniref:uncharacterized protein LOC126564805 n=1 Tax=Anopheles maculipalpis TaxID=1496333 RepID=UPI0021591B39|nr:uncharacterized protein LOC126564805 [Anopheles maculipalpis]
MVKKRKPNTITKQSAIPDPVSTTSNIQPPTESDKPNEKVTPCGMESRSTANAKKKAKQKMKSKTNANTGWVEETVEETTFNIEQCRNALEQDEHWELRRAFLEKNQHILPPDELTCLAQVYMNVQLLGCRYPPETMEMVEKLAEGIGRDYHRSRAFMLKRTFVSASDAAASKVRREDPMIAANVDATSSAGKATDDAQSPAIPTFLLNCLRNDLIILNNNFRHTMATFNALNNGVKIEANFRPNGQGMYEGFVEASGTTLAKVLASDGKRALRMAMENAMQVLSQHCYSLTRTKRATELDGIEVIQKEGTDEQDDAETDKLDTGNVGFKLLAKLGWSGGCLGVRGDGIVNPVTVNQQFGRKGLGLKATPANPTQGKMDRSMIKQKLMDLRDGKIEDHHIVFSNQYSKEDRKHIHMLAMNMRLKSQSYGKDTNGTRQLVVSRRQLRPRELMRKIMLEKDPTFCEMYEVKPPAEQA